MKTIKNNQCHPGDDTASVRPRGAQFEDRRLVLPADASSDEIHAILQDGVLELHVPRKLPPDENGKSNTIPFEEPHYEHTPS
jgi:HSP20 family molecular chaperone IbpA